MQTNVQKYLYRLAIICILIIAIGVIGTTLFANFGIKGERSWLHISVAAVFIVIFIGFQIIEDPSDSKPRSLRKSIAASVVVTYVLLVITYSFYILSSEKTLPDMTQMLLTSFTSIVGVIIASYFGASAYVEGKRSDQQEKGSQKGEKGTSIKS